MRFSVLRTLLVASLAIGVATPSDALAQNKKKPAGKKTEKKEEMKPDDGTEEKTEKKEEKTEKKEEKKDEGGKPKPPPDAKDGPKPLGAPGEGPGPAAGLHGPQTGLTESDASKPQSNPWGKAGVSAKGDGSSPSHAYASRTGVEIGGRLGGMYPIGKIASDAPMGDAFSLGIPVILDVGYRVVPQVYVGLYGQFAWVFRASDGCPGNASCTAQDYRFGVDVAYHIPVANAYELWLGGGFGYEILHSSTSADSISLGSTLSGLEYFNFQAGFDILTDAQTRVGPYLGFTAGQFSSLSSSSSGTNRDTDTSADIPNKAMHHWISLGVRGAYTF